MWPFEKINVKRSQDHKVTRSQWKNKEAAVIRKNWQVGSHLGQRSEDHNVTFWKNQYDKITRSQYHKEKNREAYGNWRNQSVKEIRSQGHKITK